MILIFGGLALIVFLSPEAGRSARLAGEEEPVTTAPSSLPTPAVAGQPAAPPVTAPPRATGASQATPRGVSAATPASSGPQLPAGSAPAAGFGRRPAPAPAGGAPAAPMPPAVPAPPPLPSVSAQKPAVAPPPPLPPAERKAAEMTPATPAGPAVAPAAPQGQAPPQPPAPAQSGRYVTIDFDNVDIQVFIKFVSELTGRNFVIDDKVKGKVTVISPKKIAIDEVYKVFESVMEIYGFTTVPAGDVIKVIPALEARGKNLELRLKKDAITPEDKIVTQILSLRHASSDEMKKVLDPLISKTSVILSYPPTGMLIITDVLSNINRLQEIVTALDVEGVGEVLSYVPLRSASATELVKSLTAVFPPQRPGSMPIRIVADDRTNSVILLASEQNSAHVKQLIGLMDKDIPRSGAMLNVYRLQNGNAEDLVKVLMNIPRDTKDTKPLPAAAAGAAAAAAAAAGRTAVLSKDVSVVADKATNTLIISAGRDDFKILEGVIQKLDEPRPMVYIEALIMEVSVSKNFNIGVEWRGLRDIGNADLKGLGPNATGLATAGFTPAQPIIPQINSTGTGVSMPPGLSLGVIGAGIQIGDLIFPNIGAVLQAYQKDSDVSILSTPQLLTLNNEDAEINVGQNVPYITRSDTQAANVGQTIGQSFEYKDVGIILKITPNINEDQFVRLKIDQQVTKISGTQTFQPTTLKRTAKTTVVVKDNETVVIGGLIDDSTSIDTSQVPCLGDIPVLGWLFKSMARGRDKSNLFVFITPHIVRNRAEAAAIYQKKLDEIGNVEEGIIKMNEKRTPTKPSTDRNP